MVIWPKRTPIRTFGADDAQFGATRQEQWLYSGTIHNALLTCVYFRQRYKRGSDDMAETNISRRRLLAATGGALMGGSMGKSVAATLDWNMARPSEAGFSDDLNARLDKAIADKRIWNMHAVVVVRGGRLVLERYFDGEDNARGKPLGVVRFGPDTLHDLRSEKHCRIAVRDRARGRQGAVARATLDAIIPGICRSRRRPGAPALDAASRA